MFYIMRALAQKVKLLCVLVIYSPRFQQSIVYQTLELVLWGHGFSIAEIWTFGTGLFSVVGGAQVVVTIKTVSEYLTSCSWPIVPEEENKLSPPYREPLLSENEH